MKDQLGRTLPVWSFFVSCSSIRRKNREKRRVTYVQSASETIVETVETQKKEKEKDDIQDSIRDHLRGFSRTIPSFLMAYGSDTVTLENIDTIN